MSSRRFLFSNYESRGIGRINSRSGGRVWMNSLSVNRKLICLILKLLQQSINIVYTLFAGVLIHGPSIFTHYNVKQANQAFIQPIKEKMWKKMSKILKMRCKESPTTIADTERWSRKLNVWCGASFRMFDAHIYW